jgi:pyruvate,water dikinase
MTLPTQEPPAGSGLAAGEDGLVVPLQGLDETWLPRVGGKAAHLGDLLRGGFAVPDGFCVTTAAYAQVAAGAGVAPLLAELAALEGADSARLAQLGERIRAAFLQTALPAPLVAAITRAYTTLGGGNAIPVAVRSSATAEDLPAASFAGQQDTYLNLVGIAAVLAGVRRSFASLWTARAISYRQQHGIAPETVQLAVIVQRLVDAQVAGVLFTANPLTGRRGQAVIDANPGLGEAVVAGLSNPDHFVVDPGTGAILERRVGTKQILIRPDPAGGTQTVERGTTVEEASCLSDDQVRALVRLGAAVETLEGRPQDIEWALDAAGQLWLVQTRPITTLFPLPTGAPPVDDDLRVYLSFNVQQGTYQPFTPLGIAAVRVVAGSLTALFGVPPADPRAGPGFVREAAGRIFLDVTTALRHPLGRRLLLGAMAEAEVQAAAILRQVSADPRLAPQSTAPWPLLRALATLLVRTRLPWHLVRVLLVPRRGPVRVARLMRRLRAAGRVPESTPPHARLAVAERLLREQVRPLVTAVAPAMVAGMQSLVLARTLLGDLASEAELQVVLRGLPDNPTTTMNRALAALAEQIQSAPRVQELVQATPPAQLAAAYRRGTLPEPLQAGLAAFLARYGHRSVSELDLGMPRWAEDPTYVLTMLAGLLQVRASAPTADTQYQQAAAAAATMMATLTDRARTQGRWRGWGVGFFLRRVRALSGQREVPRFCLALLLAQVRTLLGPVGQELVRAGGLAQAEDLFFLTFPEVQAALSGTDQRALVRDRRAAFDHERTRRQVPLVLLSDGTALTAAGARSADEATLRGTPASPGRVTAIARVIHDPQGAHLEPGEILVAPTTDPAWTPLFFRAGGLVMATGGAMAHGAIVAREVGIPAVVGVPLATERIPDGSRITVDGTTGAITLPPPPPPAAPEPANPTVVE